MSTLLPLDDNGHPISVMGYLRRGTLKVAVGAESMRTPTALPDHATVVSLIATGPVRFELGDATVTADATTSPYLHPGVYLDLPVSGAARYVALIAEGTPCEAYVIGRS